MKDDQQTNDDACSDCYIAGSVSAFRDEHQALLAELAQAVTRADALEAARDHLRARLREVAEKWNTRAQELEDICKNDSGCDYTNWEDEVAAMRKCATDLLAILSEPEEAQQTEKEPDHARMDRQTS